jgi:hypothetical protein
MDFGKRLDTSPTVEIRDDLGRLSHHGSNRCILLFNKTPGRYVERLPIWLRRHGYWNSDWICPPGLQINAERENSASASRIKKRIGMNEPEVVDPSEKQGLSGYSDFGDNG